MCFATAEHMTPMLIPQHQMPEAPVQFRIQVTGREKTCRDFLNLFKRARSSMPWARLYWYAYHFRTVVIPMLMVNCRCSAQQE